MAHWLVTHNPHGTPDDTPWFIYLDREPDPMPEPGDDVLFYETKAPGHGRGEIVYGAKVTGLRGQAPREKSDGRQWQVPCGQLRTGRAAVRAADIRRLTKYKVLQRKDGLFPLTPEEHAALVRMFDGK
jgi:hypothetical protein